MSKTEQDLEGSTEDALTDDAELIEVDPTGETDVSDGLDRALVDSIERYTAEPNGADASGEFGLPVETELPADDADEAPDASVEVTDDAVIDDEADEEAIDVADAADADDADDADPVGVDVVAADDLDDDTADVERPDDAAIVDDDTAAVEAPTADTDLDDDEVAAAESTDTDTETDTATDSSAELAPPAVPDVPLPAAPSGEIADDERSGPIALPPIVMATEVDDDDVAVDGDSAPTDAAALTDSPSAPVSRDILEELRQADIDGPIVEMAPHDDTTSARRRPKKPIDYDPAPVPIPLQVPRILGRKPRVRKVTRVVRHVDPWSVFKIAIVANMVLYLILLTAGVLLWNVAYATGTIDNVERFFESFGWQSFEFNGGEIYHALWIAGLFVAIGMTGLAVLVATLFNLITDLVGGVRFTVLEEEVVETRTSPMRRFVVRRPEPEVPAVIKDPTGPIIREAVVDDTGDVTRP